MEAVGAGIDGRGVNLYPGGRMYVTISARRCKAPATIRQRAEERLTRLQRLEPALIGAELDLSAQRGVHRVDARLAVAGSPAILASGVGDDFRAALDGAVDRLRRQITEQKSRRRVRPAERVLVRV